MCCKEVAHHDAVAPGEHGAGDLHRERLLQEADEDEPSVAPVLDADTISAAMAKGVASVLTDEASESVEETWPGQNFVRTYIYKR